MKQMLITVGGFGAFLVFAEYGITVEGTMCLQKWQLVLLKIESVLEAKSFLGIF